MRPASEPLALSSGLSVSLATSLSLSSCTCAPSVSKEDDIQSCPSPLAQAQRSESFLKATIIDTLCGFQNLIFTGGPYNTGAFASRTLRSIAHPHIPRTCRACSKPTRGCVCWALLEMLGARPCLHHLGYTRRKLRHRPAESLPRSLCWALTTRMNSRPPSAAPAPPRPP